MAINAGDTTYYQAKRGIVQDGLVLNLDAAVDQSYPGNGTAWYDLAGSNSGTLTNGPTFDRGNGGSIVFDGTDDHMSTISIPNDTGELTCEVGLNYNAKGSYHNIFEAGYNVRPMLWIDPSNKIECSYPTNSNGFTSPSSYAGEDILITVLYNTNASPGVTLYVNGQLIGSNSSAHPSWANPRDFYFFNRTNNQTFGGTIYFFRFYNKLLSLDEVQQNYNATKGRFE